MKKESDWNNSICQSERESVPLPFAIQLRYASLVAVFLAMGFAAAATSVKISDCLVTS